MYAKPQAIQLWVMQEPTFTVVDGIVNTQNRKGAEKLPTARRTPNVAAPQPYVVQRITAPDGTVVQETQPTVKRRVISEETSATMCTLMEGVVTDGTGKNAAVKGYRVGGKSGTSQKLDSENEGARISSFVAVAPIDEPRLAVLVCLDEPHSWTTSGGTLSGPVCAEVLQKALPYLGIEPQQAEPEAQP